MSKPEAAAIQLQGVSLGKLPPGTSQGAGEPTVFRNEAFWAAAESQLCKESVGTRDLGAHLKGLEPPENPGLSFLG